jgi:AraC family transcriptional regulator
MSHMSGFDVMTSFPDFKESGFSIEKYNERFNETNIVINAKSSAVFYPEHWGPLSLKCAFKGTEYYKVNHCTYAVSDHNYLLLNNDNHYSSHIDSAKEVESFTVNFTAVLAAQAAQALSSSDDFHLDNWNHCPSQIEFCEKLSPHDSSISPLIFHLRSLVPGFCANKPKIEEVYFLLIEKLLLREKEFQKEILRVPALRLSTKRELYKRLFRTKDYIDSCYNKDITTSELASISFLNQTYFLRQFKKCFQITPRQYIILKRMEAAKALLESQANLSVTELCIEVGYNDLSSFSKLFKHFYQYSPENYQKLFRRTVALAS